HAVHHGGGGVRGGLRARASLHGDLRVTNQPGRGDELHGGDGEAERDRRREQRQPPRGDRRRPRAEAAPQGVDGERDEDVHGGLRMPAQAGGADDEGGGGHEAG